MPRPRSSTFYLPLAPIDAPLELKAKLSVLPPSAANALLAPRANSSSCRPSSATSCSSSTAALTHTGNNEDECTRLNRVLGIPTSVNSSLSAPPPVTGRRRHTDAPRPSLPITRPQSPLLPFARNNNTNASNTTDWATTPAPVTHSSSPSTRTALPFLIPGSSDDDDHRGVRSDETSAMAWTISSLSNTVDADMSSGDMDAFASACEEQPAAAPTTTATVQAPHVQIQAPPPPVHAEIKVHREIQPVVAIAIAVAPAPAPLRVLSRIPCGLRTILACRTKVPSRFSEESNANLELDVASDSDSLHPQDTRFLLKREHRLAFPPPPAPLPAPLPNATLSKCPAVLVQAEEVVDESIVADLQASFPSSPASSSTSTPVKVQEPTRPATPRQQQPPRQRFRLAPMYLPKVLRRSLGPTAWARAEAVRAARMMERASHMQHAQLAGHGHLAGLLYGYGAEYQPSPDGWINGPNGTTTSCSWWDRVSHSSDASSASSEFVWGGYEDEMDVSTDDAESSSLDSLGSIWDWEDDVEPVPLAMDGLEDDLLEEDEEFVREGAPEPEERPLFSPTAVSSFPPPPLSSPPPPSLLMDTDMGDSPLPAGYSMVGKFGWDTTWPASPLGPNFPATAYSDDDGEDEVAARMPPVTRRSIRREDGEEEEEEEEEIFRYSPLKPDDVGQPDHENDGSEEMLVEGEDVHLHSSNCSTPTATSPSFPPGPLRGVAISSSSSSSSFDERETSEREETFYDADGDAEMEESFSPDALLPTSPKALDFSSRTAPTTRPTIRAPRPLSLVQHPVLQQQYPIAYSDDIDSPTTGVFVIPPSPLTNTTFETGTGSSTPRSAPPVFTDRMEEEADLANVGAGAAWGEAHALSGKRSYERIVAPRPQRVSRGLEQVLNQSAFSSSSMASLSPSPPLPTSPPLNSTSPRLPSSPRWTFGSLKSALSNSMSHLVELARSRSPSPLPWIMRGSVASTSTSAGITLAGAAAALDASSHGRQRSEEEIEHERATCVTPTPAAGPNLRSHSHSRRSSTTTITGPTFRPARPASVAGPTGVVESHLPVLKLQVDNVSADGMSESPPPKRTLSTSSLSSVGSEPDSESGSSGGIFSRSPSPEPGSERVWDPAYTLTPRSRPISADAKAAVACGGRLSPMMIPGSWDPEELWAEDGDLAKTW